MSEINENEVDVNDVDENEVNFDDIEFRFVEREKGPMLSTSVWEDLCNGYINYWELLKDKDSAHAVNEAVYLIHRFIEEAEEAGIIEIC